MAKVIACHCGALGTIDYSKGKHKTPFLRCPVHGAIMNRKKSWIDYLLSVAKDEPDQVEQPTEYKKAEVTALQELDSTKQDTGGDQAKKSKFNLWGAA